MSFGNKIFTTIWEHIFQIFFPGGFLTIEFGLYFVLGAFVLTSINLLLQIKVIENKLIIRRMLINLCFLAVSMFIPAFLGVCIAIMFCSEFTSIKNQLELPLWNKIVIIIVSIVGMLGLVGVCSILIFYWRFLFAYMLLGGFIVGVILFAIAPIQKFLKDILKDASLSNLKKIGIVSGVIFLVLGGIFASTGFIRPFIPAPTTYTPTGSMNVKLATYNIRLGTGIENNEYDSWKHRKDDIANYIDNFDADFICIQEAYHFQIRYLTRMLDSKTYNYVGAGRDDGVISGEHACIFFDSERFSVITGGSFWLSDYPFYPSQTWNGEYNKDRVVAWARFEEIATNEEVFVISVHYDSGAEFREKANVLLNNRIAEYSGAVPVIVGGDFNYNESMSGWNLMENYGTKPLQSAYHLIHGPGPHLLDTTNSFNLTYDNPINMIDFIFVSVAVSVTACEILNDTYISTDGLAHYFSDHFPLTMQCLI